MNQHHNKNNNQREHHECRRCKNRQHDHGGRRKSTPAIVNNGDIHIHIHIGTGRETPGLKKDTSKAESITEYLSSELGKMGVKLPANPTPTEMRELNKKMLEDAGKKVASMKADLNECARTINRRKAAGEDTTQLEQKYELMAKTHSIAERSLKAMNFGAEAIEDALTEDEGKVAMPTVEDIKPLFKTMGLDLDKLPKDTAEQLDTLFSTLGKNAGAPNYRTGNSTE